MALKAVYESAESIPEGMSELYAENDGRYILQVEPTEGYALEDVSGLKSALSATRTEATQAKQELKKFADIDPNEARKAQERLKELLEATDGGDVEKTVEAKVQSKVDQIVAKHQEELAAREREVQELTGTVDQVLRKQVATAAISAAKGSVDLLLPHVIANTRVQKGEDGQFRVDVVDANGNARIADAKGNNMSIEDLVAEMRSSDVFGRAFEGTGNAGSGAPAKRSHGGTGVAKKSDFKSERERADFVEKHGIDAYRALSD